MRSAFDLSTQWSTAWSGSDILVLRNDIEVDRVHAPDIRRIVFVQPVDTESAGDLSFALVELEHEFIVFPPETGFAGRVNFERQSFWAGKACIYWADSLSARLPPHLLSRSGFALVRRAPRYGRVPIDDLAPLVEHWLLEGPHSWDERRWQRIQRSRPFARIDTTVHVPPPPHLGSSQG